MQIQAKAVYKGLSGTKTVPRRWKLFALKLKGGVDGETRHDRTWRVGCCMLNVTISCWLAAGKLIPCNRQMMSTLCLVDSADAFVDSQVILGSTQSHAFNFNFVIMYLVVCFSSRPEVHRVGY